MGTHRAAPAQRSALRVSALGSWFSEGFLNCVCFSKTYCLALALALLRLSEYQYPLLAIAIAHREREDGAAPTAGDAPSRGCGAVAVPTHAGGPAWTPGHRSAPLANV